MNLREPLCEKLRVNFTTQERREIEKLAVVEQRSLASVIRLATLAYLKERST